MAGQDAELAVLCRVEAPVRPLKGLGTHFKLEPALLLQWREAATRLGSI